MDRLISSRTTQPLTSPSCLRSQVLISLDRRSAKHLRASLPFSSLNSWVVTSDQSRNLFLLKMSSKALRRVSLRRHSEQRMTLALVRSMICRRAFSAFAKKSDVSGFAVSPSVEMSKVPARAGRSTPSTSKKTTLVRSSGANPKSTCGPLSPAAFRAASVAAAVSASGCGMSPYRDSASLAAFAAARSACCFLAASTLALTRWSRVSASFCFISSSAFSACLRLSAASRWARSRSLACSSSSLRFSSSLAFCCSSLFWRSFSWRSNSFSCSALSCSFRAATSASSR
mmetsp:Transcript_25009/g.58005  ORF Transcript_25009/g.58005 Transcript_25009/m.58005 type:complete len:286 (-) Transcript_25009:452-1309(-)